MFFIDKKNWAKIEKKLKIFGSTDQQGMIGFIQRFALNFIFKILNEIIVFLFLTRALVILTILLTLGSLAVVILIVLIVKLCVVFVLVKLLATLIDELNYDSYFVLFTIVFIYCIVL